jgi:hypothetical protein
MLLAVLQRYLPGDVRLRRSELFDGQRLLLRSLLQRHDVLQEHVSGLFHVK